MVSLCLLTRSTDDPNFSQHWCCGISGVRHQQRGASAQRRQDHVQSQVGPNPLDGPDLTELNRDDLGLKPLENGKAAIEILRVGR